MSIKSVIGLILILLGIAVAVNAYSTASISSGLNVSVVEPADALLGYETYPVTIVAGGTVTTTIPIKVHNRLPDSVEITSLSTLNNPGIQVHTVTPTEIPASEEALLRVTYVTDAVGGLYPVTHRLVASSDQVDIQLTFDVDFTSLNTLDVATTPEDAGTAQGSGTYMHGATAVVEAVPNTCYEFDYWTGDVPASQSTDNPLSLTMDANKEIIAVFTHQQYELTIQAMEGGTVDPSGTGMYPCGSDVPLTATPEDGYTFSGWDGGVDGEAQTTINVTSDMQITAMFDPVQKDSGDITISETPPAEGNPVD